MKVALITPGFSTGEDHWAIPALRNLVQTLSSSLGLEVFALRYPFRRGAYLAGGVKVRAFGGGAVSGLRRLPLVYRCWQAVLAAHQREPFDLVHGFWADEPGFIALQAGRRLGIPVVVSIMGGELVSFPDLDYGGQLSLFNRWFTKQAVNQAQTITAGSAGLLRLARSYAPRASLAFLPLGLDPGRFSPGKPDNIEKLKGTRRINLLSVASLVPIKDHETLLRAFSKVSQVNAGVDLHLVGKGPEQTSIERLAASLNISESVLFHGHIPHQKLPVIYREADIYVQSSRFESQGMAVLEAAACGTPPAGTATGILPDITPGGWQSPAGDQEALANTLNQLLADPVSRRAHAAEISSRVREEFGLQRTTANLIKSYQALVDGINHRD